MCDAKGKCSGVNLCENVNCQNMNLADLDLGGGDPQCFSVGSCNSADGTCAVLKRSGATCDDNDDLTQLDRCNDRGKCVGKDLCAAVSCGAVDDCHETGFCDHTSGLCVDKRKDDGT